MLFAPQKITLKDDRSCLLRPPQIEDAEPMLAYLHQTAAETPFLLREEEDIRDTPQSETNFINQCRDSAYMMMIVAEVEGKIAGNCSLQFLRYRKISHRSTIGIALLKEFWSLGIGQAMFTLMEDIARSKGVLQLEQEVIEGNQRGIALYRKMGFVLVATKPRAIRNRDGSFLNEFLMIKVLG